MTDCAGHLNGFEHLDLDLGGLEKDFHLAHKFEPLETRTPASKLYVRYFSTTLPVPDGAFAYVGGQTAQGDSPTDSELLRRARMSIAADLKTVKDGGAPRTGTLVV